MLGLAFSLHTPRLPHRGRQRIPGLESPLFLVAPPQRPAGEGKNPAGVSRPSAGHLRRGLTSQGCTGQLLSVTPCPCSSPVRGSSANFSGRTRRVRTMHKQLLIPKRGSLPPLGIRDISVFLFFKGLRASHLQPDTVPWCLFEVL